jgi:hypothetical protein
MSASYPYLVTWSEGGRKRSLRFSGFVEAFIFGERMAAKPSANAQLIGPKP